MRPDQHGHRNNLCLSSSLLNTPRSWGAGPPRQAMCEMFPLFPTHYHPSHTYNIKSVGIEEGKDVMGRVGLHHFQHKVLQREIRWIQAGCSDQRHRPEAAPRKNTGRGMEAFMVEPKLQTLCEKQRLRKSFAQRAPLGYSLSNFKCVVRCPYHPPPHFHLWEGTSAIFNVSIRNNLVCINNALS